MEKVRTDRDFLENKVEDLEKEKKKLKRELQSLETEVRESKRAEESPSKMVDDEEIDPKRVKELEDNMRLKNKQIHQLLEDIEHLEKDNEAYQEKISSLRDELSEATKQINIITGEFVSMKKSLTDTKTLIDTLQNDNNNLKLKLEDQLKDKAKRDRQIEEISVQVDNKVEEMKNICGYKDAQIEELRARLNRAVVSSGSKGETETTKQNISVLSKAIQERDDQIEKLQDKLKDASKDLESSATLIEELKGTKKDGVDPIQKSLMNVRSQLYEAEQKVKDLKEQVHEAEESAKDKSEELSDAITKLRRYETGEYGLKEAVDEIQSLKKGIKAREKQVEELMNQCNNLQYENGEIAEENSEFREKLGLDRRQQSMEKSYQPVNKLPSSMNSRQDRALVQVMQKEIERLEEERIQLKTENRKLAQQLGQRAAKLGLNTEDLHAIQEYTEALKNRRLGVTGLDDSDPIHAIKMHESSVLMQKHLQEKTLEVNTLNKELSAVKNKYDDMFEENNKLREGMHEILDSVKEQDGKSDVIVSCPVLEQLLTILDARHYFGDYKPAMGLKSQIEKLEGVNTHLREQCRKLRNEGDKLTTQNQKLKFKMQNMETEMKTLKEGGNLFNQSINLAQSQVFVQSQPLVTTGPVLPSQLGSSSKHLVKKLETQLVQVLDELEVKDRKYKALENDLEHYNKSFGVKKHQLGLLYNEHDKDIKEFKKEKDKLTATVEDLQQKLSGANAKNIEYEEHLNTLNVSDEDYVRKLGETTRKIAILKANEAILARKYKVIEDQRESLQSQNTQLKSELVQLECHATKTIGELQRYKEMYCFKVDSLQKALEDSVPLSSLENANRQYNDITAKYRDLLQKQQNQSLHARNVEELELQVQTYKQEKDTFKKELTLSKEKIVSLESIVASIGVHEKEGKENSELAKISKQLASIEIKELNERQKNDYLNNQYKLLQTQMQHIEKRNNELEEKFEIVSASNLKLQEIERELRDQLITSIPKEDFEVLNVKYKEVLETEVQLKLEQSKLKEIADISQVQLADFEQRKDNNLLELEALRHQVLDLQTQSDEKALIGRLHQQVLSLQVKENEFIQKQKLQEMKLSKLEANILKANKRSDEMEQYCLKVRNQYNIKSRSLFKVIQDLRRQFSGAIPLLKQEKLSKTLISINEEKQSVSKMLRETEAKLKDMEEKGEEMTLRQQGVNEILDTLKNNTGAKQVLEWHAKLENLRIKELHSRRNAEHWEKEVTVLRDLCKTESRKAEQFEDDIIRLESLLEQKQLEWESKEIEMEKNDTLTFKSKLESEADDQVDNLGGNIPLSKQLDSSLRKSRTLNQEVNDLKNQLKDSKKSYEDLNKKLRESENQMIAKEKIINDLRDQLPSTVNRAVAITSVIGQPAAAIVDDDATNKHATMIAQTTIESLRERLKQKESTMGKYEKMLQQSNADHEEEIKKKQEEIIILQSTIRNQQTAFNELRSSRSNEALTSGAQIGAQVSRIQDLEDEIQEMQVSLGNLSSELMESRKANEKLNHIANIRLQELEEIKENQNMEVQIGMNQQKETIDRLNNDIRSYQQENAMLREEVERLQTSSSKTPSVTMKSQLEKLKSDLAEKDKKSKALTRAIAELKDEMLVSAEERANSRMDIGRSQQDVQRIVEKETKSYQIKVAEQNVLIDKLKKQIKTLKDSENKALGEYTKLKEQLEKKSSLILKLREERMTHSRSGSRARFRDGENEDLKNQVEVLEEKLRKINAAEKPYEDDKESKVIKNAEEVAKWEERKRWQKKIDEFKQRLQAADEEVSKMSKQNNSLRETVSRLDREKTIIEQKWKSHLKTGVFKTNTNDIRVEQLEQEIAELRAELSDKDTTKQAEPGNETLKLRVKFLQGRVEQQERKITMLEVGKKGGQSALLKEIEELRKKEINFEKMKTKIEDENVDLKIKIETIQHNIIILKESVEKLEVSTKMLEENGGSEVLIGEIIKTVKTVSEIVANTGGNGHVSKVNPSSSPKKKQSSSIMERRLSVEVENLKESLISLKETNTKLLETLEVKERKINELKIILKQTKTPQETSENQNQAESVRIRQMEVDLKRKSDLLSEVKVLLKQAADRERQQEIEKETLKRQLKLITEIDPKTPSEALAKELRQAKLTIERLACEKKEIEHQLQTRS